MDSNALIEAAYAGGAQRGRLIRLGTPLGDDALPPFYGNGKRPLSAAAHLARAYGYTHGAGGPGRCGTRLTEGNIDALSAGSGGARR
jgi:hypothetical protein